LQRLKVGLINPDGGGGGINRFYRELFEALSANADCHLIVSDPFASTKKIKDPQKGSDGIETLFALPQVARMLAAANEAWQEAKRLELDIIEVCDWPLGFVPAVLDQSVPYVVQCHGSMGQVAQHDPQRGQELEASVIQMLEPQLLAAAHSVQSLSSSNVHFWERMTGCRVSMIRPAFALPDLPDDAESVSQAAAVFGRLQRWKGPHILCAALRKLGSAAPAVNWYGAVNPWQSSDWPADKRLATDFPDVWGVHLHHRMAVPRDVVTKIQARALFNLAPSTWDVFNFTAVESMAAARPTIVSMGAGASELIIDGESGFLFENENPSSLADAIERVLVLSESRRREIGYAGRETIRKELGPERIAQQRLAAYDQAIRAFRESPPPKLNPWLAHLLTLRPERRLDPGALLELIPMRAIAGHMKDRLLRKLGWNRRWT